MKDVSLRNKFSKAGVVKVNREFSWTVLAQKRIEDYKQ
jgi:hypothetical protein